MGMIPHHPSAGSGVRRNRQHRNSHRLWRRLLGTLPKGSLAATRRQHREGMQYAGSSQNLGDRREAFVAVGGFDTGYRRYGFEDRDLLLRDGDAHRRFMDVGGGSSPSRSVRLSPGEPQDGGGWRLVVASICRRASHGLPRIGFCPPRRAPTALAASTWPGARRHAAAGGSRLDLLLQRDWIPYAVKATAVRLVTGLSYLAGPRGRRHRPSVTFLPGRTNVGNQGSSHRHTRSGTLATQRNVNVRRPSILSV